MCIYPRHFIGLAPGFYRSCFCSTTIGKVKQPLWRTTDHSEARVGLHEVDFQIAVAEDFKIETTSENVMISRKEMTFEIVMERGHVMDFEAGTETAGGRLDVVS